MASSDAFNGTCVHVYVWEVRLGPSIINLSIDRRAPQYQPPNKNLKVRRTTTHSRTHPPPPNNQNPTPADAHEAFEQTLCQVRTVHVFKIPPRVTSGGHRAGDWKDEVRWVGGWVGGVGKMGGVGMEWSKCI